ncbi:MAG: hypothetical protein WBD31_02105 [Rubripirellula sp.]
MLYSKTFLDKLTPSEAMQVDVYLRWRSKRNGCEFTDRDAIVDCREVADYLQVLVQYDFENATSQPPTAYRVPWPHPADETLRSQNHLVCGNNRDARPLISFKLTNLIRLARFSVPRKQRDEILTPVIEDLKLDYLEGLEDATTPFERLQVKACLVLQVFVQLIACITTGVTLRITALAVGVWKILSG